MNFDTDLFSHLRTQPPDFDPERIWYHFSKWSPQPDIRQNWQATVAASSRCTMVLHANVTEMRLHDNLERMESLTVRSLDGQKMTVRARAFVLCVGGIETARLLLANRMQMPAGIGNQNDLVGRFFQDHVWAGIGTLDRGDAAQALFNVFHKRGLKYSVRCTAAPKWQRTRRTLNMSMQMLFLSNSSSALQDLKDVYLALRQRRLSPALIPKWLRVMRHPLSVLSPAWHYGVRGRSFVPGAKVVVGVASEQEPNRESRVMLSSEVDALGMAKADVRWKLTELTRYSIVEYARVLAEEFRRVGIGSLQLERWVTEGNGGWKENVTDQFHHMGTARMHDSPKEGVTDGDGKVHGLANLFVGGSAVFPTGGHSNPTLTLIALCFRMADKLERRLRETTGPL
jgi:choline dehydrogenase-like flavoprotein